MAPCHHHDIHMSALLRPIVPVRSLRYNVHPRYPVDKQAICTLLHALDSEEASALVSYIQTIQEAMPDDYEKYLGCLFSNMLPKTAGLEIGVIPAAINQALRRVHRQRPQVYFKICGCIFSSLSLPLRKSCTAPWVIKWVECYGKKIIELHERLRELWKQYGEQISNTWDACPQNDREMLILIAWKMKCVEPVIQQAFRGRLPWPPVREHEDLWRCPSFNVPSLAEGNNLVIMLQSRILQHPSKFADKDLLEAKLGSDMARYRGSQRRFHLPDAWGLRISGPNGLKFGEVWDLNTYSKNTESGSVTALPQGVFNLSGGISVIRANMYILSGSFKMCQQLIGYGNKHSSIAPPGRLLHHRASLLMSLPAAWMYDSNHQANMGAILPVVTARCRAAEDCIHSMREDPEYFLSFVQRLSNYDEKRSNSSNTDLKDRPLPRFGWAVGRMVQHVYQELSFWNHIRADVKSALDIKSRLALIPSPGQDLPHAYGVAVGKLSAILLDYQDALQRRLSSYGGGPRGNVLCKPKLTKLINRLEVYNDDINPPIHSLLEEIERVHRRETRDNVLPCFISSLLSDWSVIARMSRAIVNPFWPPCFTSQPWSLTPEQKTLIADQEINYPKRAYVALMYSFGAISAPSPNDFRYPRSTSTKDHVRRRRSAEQQLDNIWAHIDDITSKVITSGKTIEEEYHPLFSVRQKLARTPAWIEVKEGDGTEMVEASKEGVMLSAEAKPAGGTRQDEHQDQSDHASKQSVDGLEIGVGPDRTKVNTLNGPAERLESEELQNINYGRNVEASSQLADTVQDEFELRPEDKGDESTSDLDVDLEDEDILLQAGLVPGLDAIREQPVPARFDSRNPRPKSSKPKHRQIKDQAQKQAARPPPLQKAPKVAKHWVSQESTDVMSVIFFVRGKRHFPVLRMNEFVTAMKDVGFTARKGYGSKWHFYAPEESETLHDITIHGPHGDEKGSAIITLRDARGIGKQLFAAFGWTIDSFGVK